MRYAITTPVLALSCALCLAQAPKPAKPSAETAPIDTSTVEKILRGDEAVDAGQGFTYDPAGRRDPFRSLLAGQLREELGQRPPGLRGMGIDEIRLEGLIKLREGYVAMVQGTDNLAYMVRPGTVLYDGYVDRIEPGRLVFKMQVADPKSLKPYREVIRTLQ
jgi:type IV pilus assembly protein PilP